MGGWPGRLQKWEATDMGGCRHGRQNKQTRAIKLGMGLEGLTWYWQLGNDMAAGHVIGRLGMALACWAMTWESDYVRLGMQATPVSIGQDF